MYSIDCFSDSYVCAVMNTSTGIVRFSGPKEIMSDLSRGLKGGIYPHLLGEFATF